MPGCLKRFTKKTSVVGHFKRYHAHEPMTDDLESHLRDMMRPDEDPMEEPQETLLYQTVSGSKISKTNENLKHRVMCSMSTHLDIGIIKIFIHPILSLSIVRWI